MNPPTHPPEVLTQLRISDERVDELRRMVIDQTAPSISAAEIVALCDELRRARRKLAPVQAAAKGVVFAVNGDRQLVMKAPAEMLARLVLAGLETLGEAEVETATGRGRPEPS